MTDVLIAATIREEGPLRASVEVSIKISDSSYLKQMISLDADSPYLRVECEVSYLHLYVWCSLVNSGCALFKFLVNSGADNSKFLLV